MEVFLQINCSSPTRKLNFGRKLENKEEVKDFQKFSCRTHLKLLGVITKRIFLCKTHHFFPEKRNTVRTHI